MRLLKKNYCVSDNNKKGQNPENIIMNDFLNNKIIVLDSIQFKLLLKIIYLNYNVGL